jgi:dihydrofolate synthase/folylpolyglutamate synthase
LLGAFQAENAATAVAAVDALGGATPDAIVRGLEIVRWPGRLEVLRERPLVVADGAHNRQSARRLVEALREHFGVSGPDVAFVIGVMGDKDLTGLVEELRPVAARVLAARAAHPRAMDPKRIVAAFERAGVPCEDVDSVRGALQRALAATDEGGVICLAGSLFVAAEAREYFERA